MPYRSIRGIENPPETRNVWGVLVTPITALLLLMTGLGTVAFIVSRPTTHSTQNRPPSQQSPTAGSRQNQAAAKENPNLTYEFSKMAAESGVLEAAAVNGELDAAAFLKQYRTSGIFDPQRALDAAATVKTTDLTATTATDAASVKAYFNAVYGVYARHLVPIKEDDLEILAAVLETKDYRRLEELKPIIAALEQSFQEIRKIPVPDRYRTIAALELNYLLKTTRAIETFLELERDPLAATLMYPERISLQRKVRIFHELVERHLAEKGITFQAGEGGHALFAARYPTRP